MSELLPAGYFRNRSIFENIQKESKSIILTEDQFQTMVRNMIMEALSIAEEVTKKLRGRCGIFSSAQESQCKNFFLKNLFFSFFLVFIICTQVKPYASSDLQHRDSDEQ